MLAQLFAVLLFACLAHGSQRYTEVVVEANGVSARAMSSSFSYMELRIADPQGDMIYQASSDGGSIYWSAPGNLADGRYSWEVRLGSGLRSQNRREDQIQNTISRSEVESGSFLISGGMLLPATMEEAGLLDSVLSRAAGIAHAVSEFFISSAHADQIINDDLIVTFSTCIGTDCANGEAFGFDTLRLKENNLRIRFMDTSNSGSFPTNDWEITANDSINGGRNYFGFMDVDRGRTLLTLEAGAPANSLYLHSSGRFGLGTSQPSTELHIIDGDTPTVRLEQDGTFGWTPQVWDVGANETNFFVRDATNASRIPFKIVPGAAANSLVIDSNGNVGLGERNPTHKLHVVGNALITGNLELSSSRELKDNIESLDTDEALRTMAALRPVTFQYKAEPEEKAVGFIAEEVPDLVATNGRKSVSPMDVLAVMTKVVQEQQKTIEELKREVGNLHEQIQKQAMQKTSVSMIR
jgi:hypothetical protein